MTALNSTQIQSRQVVFVRLVRYQGKINILLKSGRFVEQLFDKIFVDIHMKKIRRGRITTYFRLTLS
ncbi:MAG: hypothetical protein ACJAT1_000620 [Marivirga sp.]|jgi:hypothetical protein